MIIQGTIIRIFKGDTRSLDSSSYIDTEQESGHSHVYAFCCGLVHTSEIRSDTSTILEKCYMCGGDGA